MKKIYEQIPIETWKKIAYKVQRLKLSDCSTKEFDKNLKMLQTLLSDLEVCIDAKSQNPESINDIGLATLLKSIYEIKNSKNFTKAAFYEYIYTLSDLGIETLEYIPVDFYTDVEDLRLYRDFQNGLELIDVTNKCYTDGSFQLSKKPLSENVYSYNLNNLKDATYILSVELRMTRPILKCRNYAEKYQLVAADATVKNFNGQLPSKEEFLSMDFPKLVIDAQQISWEEDPTFEQQFEYFDCEKLSCRKRLTKTPKDIWYYKEFKK